MNEANSFRKDNVLAGAHRSLGNFKHPRHLLVVSPKATHFSAVSQRAFLVRRHFKNDRSHQIRYPLSISLMWLMSFSGEKAC
jgi:hypothetical protein